ncbi:MAG: hypothetical protein ACK6DC_14300 [Planctomycetota bacterium]|jgi:hypothetical protein
MKLKVAFGMCLFVMPMFLSGCGGGSDTGAKEAPPDVKTIVESQKKMYENMKKGTGKASR